MFQNFLVTIRYAHPRQQSLVKAVVIYFYV